MRSVFFFFFLHKTMAILKTIQSLVAGNVTTFYAGNFQYFIGSGQHYCLNLDVFFFRQKSKILKFMYQTLLKHKVYKKCTGCLQIILVLYLWT